MTKTRLIYILANDATTTGTIVNDLTTIGFVTVSQDVKLSFRLLSSLLMLHAA